MKLSKDEKLLIIDKLRKTQALIIRMAIALYQKVDRRLSHLIDTEEFAINEFSNPASIESKHDLFYEVINEATGNAEHSEEEKAEIKKTLEKFLKFFDKNLQKI